MTRIVVGVDGSVHSQRALRRALEEAALRGGTVDAVYVYTPAQPSLAEGFIGLPFGVAAPVGGGTISPDAPGHHPPTRDEEAQDRAERELERFVSNTLGDVPGPMNLVALPAGHPAEALIEQSRSADLLVIGTRGLGGFAGMLLGSVAQQCIQRSRCPVLVLPPED